VRPFPVTTCTYLVGAKSGLVHEHQAAGGARAMRAGEAVYEHGAAGRERTFDKVEELLDEDHHLLSAGWLFGLRQ
jgi:hypothetical protein